MDKSPFKVGDIIRSRRYPKGATGIILTTKIGWVNRLNQIILLDNIDNIPTNIRNQIMKDYKGNIRIPIKERNRTYFLPEDCHIVKFIKDKYGNPYRKPFFRVLHKHYLEKIKESTEQK